MFNLSTSAAPLRDRAEVTSTARQVGAAAPLGNTTSLPSDLAVRRVTRYLLQSAIAEILPQERVSNCLRLVLPLARGVKVLYSDEVKRAHYGNLAVCGSIWSCPVCSAKITERRRLEIGPALKGWSGGLIMAAFTLQHTRTESLASVKSLLYSAYLKLVSGYGWQQLKKRWGILGIITSSEVTWGNQNGWHPHKHALIFTHEKLTTEQVLEAEKEVSARFRAILETLGGYGHPNYSVAFRIGDSFEEGAYVCKWGLDYELTKSPVKRARGENYSPFELATWAASTGESRPVQLFREYFLSYKGSHQLSYSKGLRGLLGLDTVEKTDIELATEEDQKAIEMAELSRDVWSVICKKNLRGHLLEVASSGSMEDLNSFLESLGFSLKNAL